MFFHKIMLMRNVLPLVNCLKTGRKKMAARPGFEPRQTEPESVVLPLHHRAVRSYKKMAPAAGFEPATKWLTAKKHSHRIWIENHKSVTIYGTNVWRLNSFAGRIAKILKETACRMDVAMKKHVCNREKGTGTIEKKRNHFYLKIRTGGKTKSTLLLGKDDKPVTTRKEAALSIIILPFCGFSRFVKSSSETPTWCSIIFTITRLFRF